MIWWNGKSVIARAMLPRPILTAAISIGALAHPGLAGAQDTGAQAAASADPGLFDQLPLRDLAMTSMTLGIIAFGVVTGLLYIRSRAAAASRLTRYEAEVVDLRHRLDRSEALLAAEDTVIISWTTSGRAEFAGSLTGLAATTRDATGLLDFEGWLRASSAEEIARAIEQLRAKGEGFNAILYRLDGSPVEADGRIRSGRAILRLRHAQGHRVRQAMIEAERDHVRGEIKAVKALIKSAGIPAWLRDAQGAVVWANQAYADLSRRFFNGESAEGRDLMRVSALAGPAPKAFAARFPNSASTGELSLKVDDHIDVYDLVEFAFEGGAFGLAERRAARDGDKAARTPASFRTFNQLGTGVVLFNAARRLVFANDAFRTMFDIDQRWTMPASDHGQILDALREAQYLPLEVDYRSWKAERLKAYEAQKTLVEHWHLPDGRTLRVVADPQPDGGLACLFEDETERLTLESRFNSLMRLQRETLENMREAVAVFSSDGRMNFSNPAFARLWNLSVDRVSGRPHIENVSFACKPLFGDDETWMALRHTITDVAESRAALHGRMDLSDGRAIDYATLPLPDGATLVTFADVTDQVASERVLQDRNEALEAAAELKNSFIQHVSYELRTPLTSVIGFAELLASNAAGELRPKQSEYVADILTSSDSLLAIIDNILDLATIDAGAMELEFGPVNTLKAIETAANGVRDRLKETGLRLQVEIQEGLGAFEADEARLRQVLFNLLSNAIGFSEKGQTIRLICDRAGDVVRFRVSDEGRGIDPGDVEEIFDRFVTKTGGTAHRGAGLGLSIVKSLVELHEGAVRIDSEVGRGTTVTCVFPAFRGAKVPPPDPEAERAETAAPGEAG